MKEQSHKSEMRAALQGDFQRLRARREDGALPVAVASAVEEPMPEPESVQPVVQVMPAPTAVEPPPARTSWLDRLRERR